MRGRLAVLLTTKTISDIGYALDYICFNTFIWIRTGSPFATGMLVAVFYIGGVMGGHVTHRWGDRWNRRHALITADFLRMVMVLILVAMPDDQRMWWLYLTVFVVGSGRSIFDATLSASLPVLAPDRLQLVNSLVTALHGAALVVGMSFAALATKSLGFTTLFIVDAGTYALSVGVLVLIPLQFQEARVRPVQAATMLRVPWKTFVTIPIALVVAVRAIDAFGSGTHHVGLPMLGSILTRGDPARAYGFLWAMWAVGMVCGSFLLRPLLREQIQRNPQSPFFAATIMMSLGFIGLFWAARWEWLLCGAIIAGCGDGLSDIAFRHTLQQVSDRWRGGIFGIAEMGKNGGLILGILFTGAVALPSTIAWWVLALHGAAIIVASAAWLRRRG
jgi:MFS family permease